MSEPGLYKLILVWRGLKKTVPYDHGHYINDKILLLSCNIDVSETLKGYFGDYEGL